MIHKTFINPNIYEEEFKDLIEAEGIPIKKDKPLDFIVAGRYVEVKGLRQGVNAFRRDIYLSKIQVDALIQKRGYVVIVDAVRGDMRVINPSLLKKLLVGLPYYIQSDSGLEYVILPLRWKLHTLRLINYYLSLWKNGTRKNE